MKKIFKSKCIIFFGLLLFFTFMPQIIPASVSIAQASEIEKERINEPRLNIKSITLANGKSFTLKVVNIDKDFKDAKIVFKSANPEIASVSEDGTLTANKSGSTTITATVRQGLTTIPLTCEVKTGPPAFSVKLTRSRIILEEKQSVQLETVIKPINTVEAVKFIINDDTVATVSPGGRITAKAPGMTYAFAMIDANKFSSCSVIVSKPEDVAPLNEYFALHPELSMIPESELSKVLFDFFNSSNKPLDALSSDNDTLIEPTPPATNEVATMLASDELSGSTTAVIQNEPSLVERLDEHLNSTYDLAELKLRYEERFNILAGNATQLSSLFRFNNLIRR